MSTAGTAGADPGRRLFLRWGEPQSNARILSSAHYDVSAYPPDGLIDGAGVELGEPIFAAMARHEAESDAHNKAGAGLYVSEQLDTWAAGSDLMVVELTDRQGRPLTGPALAKAARAYTAAAPWRVISQASPDVVVRVRPPSRTDGEAFGRELIQGLSGEAAMRHIKKQVGYAVGAWSRKAPPGVVAFLNGLVLSSAVMETMARGAETAASGNRMATVDLLYYAAIADGRARDLVPERREAAGALFRKALALAPADAYFSDMLNRSPKFWESVAVHFDQLDETTRETLRDVIERVAAWPKKTHREVWASGLLEQVTARLAGADGPCARAAVKSRMKTQSKGLH
jgi:hypothetical protein